MLNTCEILSPLDDGDAVLAAGLDRLLPEEAFAISDSLTDASDLQITNVNARISSLREQQGSTLNQVVNAVPSGGGAASTLQNMELFLTGQVSNGDVDGGRLHQDADLTASQITLGVDYRLSNNFIVGAGIGIFQQKMDFSATAGDSEVEGTNFTVFSTYVRENLSYFDIVLDFGSNKFDFSRQINLGENNQVLAL